MPGMYGFSCGQAYSAHSNSIEQDESRKHQVEPVGFLSYLHNTKNQTADPIAKPHRNLSIGAGIKVDDWFEIAVFAISFLMLGAIGLGLCGLVAWLQPKTLPPAQVQQVIPPVSVPMPYGGPGYYPVTPQGSVLSSPSVGYGITMTDPGYVAISRLRTTVCR